VDDGIRSYDAGSILADAQRVMHSGFLQFEVVAGMKTDRIRTDITDIIFVFVFLFEFGFEYG
jgi:hypothetical protein